MVYSSERFESSLCAMLSWPTVIRKTSLGKREVRMLLLPL
uniref:Uncharacterized protein n=1 Tax=Anguilla anguilla TaxID=7936 RepID=A0A0E9QLW1_ANGAN